jgi:hypothetical protein
MRGKRPRQQHCSEDGERNAEAHHYNPSGIGDDGSCRSNIRALRQSLK